MRAISILVLGLMLSACGEKASNSVGAEQAAPAILDAQQLAAKFKAAALPVADVKVVTAESDDNQLLGRPGQYTSKVFFFDARHPQSDDDNENTIEVFATEADAKTRHDYIDGVTKGVPMLLQYQLLHGTALVRLSKALTPAEVDGYKKALGM